MLWLNGKKIGETLSANGSKLSALYYAGHKIWQSLSKFWRRSEKWKRNQKW